MKDKSQNLKKTIINSTIENCKLQKNKKLSLNKVSLPEPENKTDIEIINVAGKYFISDGGENLDKTTRKTIQSRWGPTIIKKNCIFCNRFTIEPDHFNYKTIIGEGDKKLYNKYYKLPHDPKEGEWKTIEIFLKHIFQGWDYTNGIEYFYNLYVNPKQPLPFLGLVSEEKGTGKTTFLNFLKILFGGNSVMIGSHDFSKEFNSHYAAALVITSDEHTEGKERKKIAQKLKMMVTQKTARIEGKGMDPYNAKVYFKVVFCGNDEEMLTYIEKENTRYCIIRLKPFTTEPILNIEEKLKEEAAAFLYYLKKVYKAKLSRGRLYFSPDEFQTEAGKLIQENSKCEMQQNIEDLVDGIFFENEELKELYFSPKNLIDALNLKNTDKHYLTKILKKKMKMEPSSQTKYIPGHLINTVSTKINGRPYLFCRKK